MNKKKLLSKYELSPISTPYYSEIVREKDLMISYDPPLRIPLYLSKSNYSRSDFYISPSNTNFDTLVIRTVKELDNRLGSELSSSEVKDKILNKAIGDVIDLTTGDKTFKNTLLEEGYTGKLSMVASKLNHSSLEEFTRFLLSNENIFFFLSYRIIYGYKITDKNGISSKLRESVDSLKPYINRQLTERVVKNENLNVRGKSLEKLKDIIEHKSLNYTPDNPTKIIVKTANNLKKEGGLLAFVTDFLNSDEVQLDPSLDMDSIANRMLQYLKKIGFNYPNKLVIDSCDSIELKDNLTLINGIGVDSQEILYENGICTFKQLSETSNEKLEEIFPLFQRSKYKPFNETAGVIYQASKNNKRPTTDK